MSNSNDTISDENKTIDNKQCHSGPGDNVLGDKIINQAIQPKNIHTSIQYILTELRHRQPAHATEQLNTLKTTSNQDTNTTDTLNIIQILVDLAEDNPPTDSYQQLNNYLKKTNDPLCKDIALSTQIRFDAKNNNLSDARDRYRNIETHGEYTNEAYFEFIAEYTEIEDIFKSKRLQLTEPELCGLIRGCIKHNYPHKALNIAEHLLSISPSFNSDVLIILSKINILNLENEQNTYWKITASARRKLHLLCDEVIDLLNKCDGSDSRIIDVSSSLLHFMFAEYKPLADACWKHIAKIEKLRPEVAEKLRLQYERHPSNLENISHKIVRAQEDPSYRQKVITEIIQSPDISTEESAILSNIGDKASIQEWMNAGGNISSTNQLESDFSILNLKVLACDGKPETIEILRSLTNKLISNHQSELINLNPTWSLDLAYKLIDLGISAVACELLKPQIPASDIWPSPIVRCYLNALLESQQIMTLNTTLSEIDRSDWDDFIWQINARLSGLQHKYEDAINSTEESLKLNPQSLYTWYHLIYFHKKNGDNKELITQALNRIPDKLFYQASKIGYQLLNEFAVTGNFEKSELFLLNWFINNPNECAINFTNFQLSMTMTDCEDDILNPKATVGSCIGGVTYAADGKISTKLLITDEITSHQSLLSTSSPLGQLLSEMEVTETKQHGMQKIDLIERHPPYIAAFHIALTLRQALNDGSDCFHSFQLPEDPKEMLESLEQKLIATSPNKNTIYSDPNIPLFMKGHHYSSSNPVKSALYHLTVKQSIKQPLPAFGEENSEQVILDIYSASYLALTGLIHGLEHIKISTVITIETKQYIEQWLYDVNRDDYLTLSAHPDGGLLRQTADDVRQQTAKIQEAFNLILSDSEIISPNLVDIPPDVLRIDDAVDLSVLSSLKLSITNEIHWLCIDPIFAQLTGVSDFKTVNANLFFSNLATNLILEEKLQGLSLHAFSGLPYPLTFEEMIQLSKSKDIHSQYCLVELLKMNPKAFSSTETAIQFLHQILVSVLANAYFDGEILNGLRANNPRNNGLTERIFNACCYISMQCDDKQEAEHKLAMLLASLLLRFNEIQPMCILINDMGSVFITGHFLNLDALNRYIKELIDKS